MSADKATTQDFKDLGFRIVPFKGAAMSREDVNARVEGKEEKIKKVFKAANGTTVPHARAIPKDWTNRYGQKNNWEGPTDLGSVVCGALPNVTASETEVVVLDCDNAEAWDFFTRLDPHYLFRCKSRGKPGGTILYQLCAELRELSQYSTKNFGLDFEYLAKRGSGANAMANLPTFGNKTKEPINLREAKFGKPPKTVISAIFMLKPVAPILSQDSKGNLSMPYNAPLLELYVKASKTAAKGGRAYGNVPLEGLALKVYKIFTPKKFRSAQHYIDKGWLAPYSEEIAKFGTKASFLVGVSAIAGRDPSIGLALYVQFMNVFNFHLSSAYTSERLLEEFINPMTSGSSSINGESIWRYDKRWDTESLTVANQYGETLEYLIIENEANKFIEYNHTTGQVVEVQGIGALRDQIYSRDTDVEGRNPSKAIVKKLKLVTLENSIRRARGLAVDDDGKASLNSKEPMYPLSVLRDPSKFSLEVNETNIYVEAFNLFLEHLTNGDKESTLFMKQLIAYHGRHLSSIPVIIYMVGMGGAGKSIFGEFMGYLFGSNAVTRPSAEQVKTRFTDYLEDKAVMILTETSDAPRKERAGIKAVLKTVTGEQAIDMETKNQPMRTNVPVFVLPILLANSPWYEEDDNDRRLFSIIPKSKLDTFEPILNFERENDIKIKALIIDGIKKGYISKYLSSFLPKRLGEVPITRDKLLLASEQADAVSSVKSLINNQQWDELFDKFEEYDISSFFTYMELNKPVDKDALFIGHLVELCDEMSTDLMSGNINQIKKRFNALWLPKVHRTLTPSPSLPAGVRLHLGYHKWHLGILQPYQEWKFKKQAIIDQVGDFT